MSHPEGGDRAKAKVVTQISQKGGVGKTFITVNLAAVSGRTNPPQAQADPCPVVAAGIDRQGSLEEWSSRVPEEQLPFDYVVTRGRLGELPELVGDPAVRRVFVDTPGFVETDPDADLDADPLGDGPAGKAMREVLDLTDLALVPITEFMSKRPAEFTIERVLKPRGVPFLVVINQWESGSDRERKELGKQRQWCVEHGYPFAPQAIRRFKIHAQAPEKGLTVIQYPESGTALRAREDMFQLALAVEQAL